MSETFPQSPESPTQFQDRLAKLPLDKRFAVVNQLSLEQKKQYSLDIKYTDGTQTFVQIPADIGRAKPIFIVTDPLGYNENTVDEARLLPVWRSEQPVYQEFGHEFIISKIRQKADQKKPLVSIDVGCGSGISSLWLQSLCGVYPELQVRNIGIDLSPRAIKASKENAKLNGYQDDQIEWVLETYNLESITPNSADIIFLAPPYNPRPTSFADTLTPHADGWDEEGTANFKSQIDTALYHLAPGGTMLINQMLPSKRGTDEHYHCVKDYFGKYKDILVNFVDVYPPISSQVFLDGVYPDELTKLLSKEDRTDVAEFKKRLIDEYSHFSYNIFAVEKHTEDIAIGYPAVYSKKKTISHNRGTWQDRIDLHKAINVGMIKRRVAAQNTNKSK